MKTYSHLFDTLISLENLEDAYWRARKRKSNNPRVKEFDEHWRLHLINLHKELKNKTYAPLPLKTFILRDPKTRKICVSEFRDRVVHHAIVNILQPIFESRFIHDSYASRRGKGTLAALKRFETFLRKVTENGKCLPDATNANYVCGFALKADIKHYFDTVDHEVLMRIIGTRIKDARVLWLCENILKHYNSGYPGKGMPLGNWTSQFFANVYLNELDQFIKHKLKAKYYLRYVDDFIILHKHKIVLQEYERAIKELLTILKLELHPTKCQIVPLSKGVSLLGFRAFYKYKLVRQRNLRKIFVKMNDLFEAYEAGMIDAATILERLQAWNAYAMQGNTYRLRQRLRQDVEQALTMQTNPND